MKSFIEHTTSLKSESAVIIIDMQNEFCSPGGWCDKNGLDYSYCQRCINPINKLVASARKNDVPVVWLNWGIEDINSIPKNQFYLWKKKKSDVGLENGHFKKGSKGVQIIKELKKQPTDIYVDKERISGFAEGSNLHDVLKSKKIKKLYFCGVNTDQCVLHTMADGNFLGYDCILVKECCSTNSPKGAEKYALYNAGECFGRVMGVDEVINFNVEPVPVIK